MTHKVWLVMIGLDIDLWTCQLVEKAFSSFGQLVIWEEDQYNLSRAIVKVTVSSLKEIPWFFMFTEELNFESDSWSVQTEIIQATMLGNAAQDEDFLWMMEILTPMTSTFMDDSRDRAHHPL
jgi:hypothetical protein